MDILQEQAIAYQKLMQYEYYFAVAYKDSSREFILRFPIENFLHLTGIHKLKDLPVHRMSSEKLFTKCLNGKITYNSLTCSEFFSLIENRICCIAKIEELLDSKHLVIICNGNFMREYSNIKADFINEGKVNNCILYLFLQDYSKNKVKNIDIDQIRIVYPISCFPKGKTDYRKKNMVATILKHDKRILNN